MFLIFRGTEDLRLVLFWGDPKGRPNKAEKSEAIASAFPIPPLLRKLRFLEGPECKKSLSGLFFFVAERGGFEPPVPREGYTRFPGARVLVSIESIWSKMALRGYFIHN